MLIRPYEAGDAAPLAALYVRSVEGIGPRDYTAAQVAAWASLAPSPERLHVLGTDGRTRLVAVDDAGRPVAFADLEPDGHIHFLYCCPETAGRGVAAALYDALERRARGRGMPRLYTEASEAARRFFLNRGFFVVARRDLEVAGVAIHNYAMEKSLAEAQTV
jgi:putative acetyltransferase